MTTDGAIATSSNAYIDEENLSRPSEPKQLVPYKKIWKDIGINSAFLASSGILQLLRNFFCTKIFDRLGSKVFDAMSIGMPEQLLLMTMLGGALYGSGIVMGESVGYVYELELTLLKLIWLDGVGNVSEDFPAYPKFSDDFKSDVKVAFDELKKDLLKSREDFSGAKADFLKLLNSWTQDESLKVQYKGKINSVSLETINDIKLSNFGEGHEAETITAFQTLKARLRAGLQKKTSLEAELINKLGGLIDKAHKEINKTFKRSLNEENCYRGKLNIARGGKRHVKTDYNEGFLLSVAFSVPVMLALYFSKSFLVNVLRQEEAIASTIEAYFHGFIPGVIGVGGFLNQIQLFLSTGKPLGMPLVTVLNTGLSLAFAYPLGLGVGRIKGGPVYVGLGCSIGAWLTFGLTSLYLRTSKYYRRYGFGYGKYPGERSLYTGFTEQLKLALPISIQAASELIGVSIITDMTGWLNNPKDLAAQQIGLQWILMAIWPQYNINQVVGVIVAKLLGAESYEDVQRYAKVGRYLSFGLSFLFLGLLEAFQGPLIAYFTIDKAIAKKAAAVLFINGLSLPFDATRTHEAGVLRGYKDTRYAMAMSIINVVGIGTALGYLLGFTAGMGVNGIYIGRVLGVVLGSAWVTKRGYWFTADPERAVEYMQQSVEGFINSASQVCSTVSNAVSACFSCSFFGGTQQAAQANLGERAPLINSSVNSNEPNNTDAASSSSWPSWISCFN